ncbi:MAG TPA: type 1 glutamine amidotransferase [Gallionella sp.]|nr:type 1 glutamine amidotransferase [Gallionella sp.]
MKPVAIFRHTATEGPGYLSTFLDQRQIPWQLIAIDAGNEVPQDAAAFSGLVFMGGPMSVNDDLPWIPKVEALIRDAVAKDVPLLGHCLGGQLISKALGAVVSRNPVKEIGWGGVRVSANDIARNWFGNIKDFEAFHWHGETFALPRGATHLLSSAYCANQAYAIGKHLALQCHVEMTAELIASWCAVGADEVADSSTSPAVQSVIEMQRQMNGKLPRLNRVADQLYGIWTKNLHA